VEVLQRGGRHGIVCGMSEGTLVVLDDGRRLSIRPIRADDTDRLRAMHRRHSPATIRRRFFAMLPELAPVQADRFTHVDGTDRAALVAVDATGELVGVARYDRFAGTKDAEVAIVVQDDFQHHGLGTTLLNELTGYARDHGIERFIADVLMENSPMFATFADAGLVGTSQYESGVAHLVLTIPPA
jgi:GNAT superfamily N-acetyltransferase